MREILEARWAGQVQPQLKGHLLGLAVAGSAALMASGVILRSSVQVGFRQSLGETPIIWQLFSS
jgi:hypothetical protein